jgi:glycosyltransferase involved in cell wall biosynthesis
MVGQTVKPVMAGATIEVTAIILTLNEADFIEDCINHLKPYVDLILVLDGCSQDGTQEKAVKLGAVVVQEPFRGSFAETRNYAQYLAPTNWCLHVDADERFQQGFLKNMKTLILESNVKCFRFPRINLDRSYKHVSDPKDHQVRLLDKRYGVWHRKVHEIVWNPALNKPLDQCGDAYVKLLDYPIIHLVRPKIVRKTILERWKTLEKL